MRYMALKIKIIPKVLDSSHLPFDNSPSTTTDQSDVLAQFTNTSNIDVSDEPAEENEIIDTEYFDIPLISATANAASAPVDSHIESDAVITDHLQYLSYKS